MKKSMGLRLPVLCLISSFFVVGLSAAASECRVHLSDHSDKSNPIEVDIIARKAIDSRYSEKYAVTENPGHKFQETLTAAFNGEDSAMIATDAVPHPTKKELLKDYDEGITQLLNKQMNSEGGGQIIFTTPKANNSIEPKNQCDSIEATLIEFFVNEFFFYG